MKRRQTTFLRACSGFIFELNEAKFYSGQGVMREDSHSYATEEQRRAERNLARVGRIVSPQQALSSILLLTGLAILTAFSGPAISTPSEHRTTSSSLEEQAFQILDTKCNICHRRQNPFMVFKRSNMEKRADRIYRAVFVQRRMPKGDDIRLTAEEYATLEQWLNTKIND